jgi:hypothetical protein
MQRTEGGGGGRAAVWVLLVLVAGLLIGLLLSALPDSSVGPRPGHGWGFRFETHEDVDVILSTVGIALLVALLVVYGRTYSQTGARFALGLTVVLFALLLQSLFTSPLVYGALGTTAAALGPFLMFADLFKAAALTVFLYLSLQ